MKILLIIFIFISTVALAGSSVTKNWSIFTPPTVTDKQLYNYMYFIYSHYNQSQIVTLNPNGSTQGQAGNFLLYNNGGNWKVCFETAQPSGTTWKCTANLS